MGLWVITGMALVFALGSYNKAIAAGERGSFAMNFPATGIEAGGPSPRQLTGQITVPVENAGFLKRIVQPDVVEIVSHVVKNTGSVPRRVRFLIEGVRYPYEWHSRDRAWNEDTGEIERAIAPGEAVDFGFTVTLPRPLPASATPVDGRIVIVDAQSGARLSVMQIRVVREGSFVGGACCEP